MRLSLLLSLFLFSCKNDSVDVDRGIIDVHAHAAADTAAQFSEWRKYGVEEVWFSSSWDMVQLYQSHSPVTIRAGLMIPCPRGKVPYSGQTCYTDSIAFPDSNWVRHLIEKRRIQFLGELLTQYAGMRPDDSRMDPYYRLAVEYDLPVGIHTGLAGPDHGCPDFDSAMGNPALIEPVLKKFPDLKLWLMHAGGPYHAETITLMKKYPNVFADISVLCNPDIVPTEIFQAQLQNFIREGLEDRLMFGSDNGNYDRIIKNFPDNSIVSEGVKRKLFAENVRRIEL